MQVSRSWTAFAHRTSLARVIVLVAIVAAISLLQYVLVTNGAVTGDFYTSDTGRLSPWPTYLPLSPGVRFSTPVRWLLSGFVAPASWLVHGAANYANAHQQSAVFRVFAWAYRTPEQEHLFLCGLVLFNILAWVAVLAVAEGAYSRFRPKRRAA